MLIEENDMDKKASLQIVYDNLVQLLNDPKYGISMRKLSTELGRSGNYIQKLISDQSAITIDALNDISDYFDVPLWTFFIDHKEPSGKCRLITEHLSGLSDEALNTILCFVQFIAKNDTVHSVPDENEN